MAKPHRHHHVIRHIVRKLDVDAVDALGDDQGFLDDTGQYLTRHEALRHAIECKQLKLMKRDADVLFSEDVW